MLILVLLALALGGVKLLGVLTSVSSPEWIRLVKAGGASMGRVLSATVLATCWTLPIGLWIGLSPTWSRRLQPFVQVVASFPASILFVALIVALQRVGVDLFTSSILLMTLSTQWYLLFNIIAGAQAVPMNLREAAKAYRFGLWKTAWKLYFPAIFPFLVTGWVTATGGAWNASIITEIVQFRGQTYTTFGLGAIVTQSADEGNIPLLAASAILMAFMVVLFNRLVWAPLYRLAETRYALNR
jgi:NitT/TauT family transport system permease protein